MDNLYEYIEKLKIDIDNEYIKYTQLKNKINKLNVKLMNDNDFDKLIQINKIQTETVVAEYDKAVSKINEIGKLTVTVNNWTNNNTMNTKNTKPNKSNA